MCKLHYLQFGFKKYLMHFLFIAYEVDGVIAWYISALQRLFHFIAGVSFLSITFFFIVLWILLLAEVLR